MIDQRKDRQRRRGEKNGKIDWVKMIDHILIVAILLCCLWLTWIHSANITRKSYETKIEDMKLECLTEKMQFHGKYYTYFTYQNKDYFVKDPKDTDNKKKWILVK
jgi:hypothetical protein